jgi:glycosyltransferase involved in cell wall biosynthesis
MQPKVAFVCLEDAARPEVISGGPYRIRKAFQELGCEVVDIFPVKPRISWTFLPKKIFYRLLGLYYHWEWEPLFQRHVARYIEGRLSASNPDLVYVVQPQAVSQLRTKIPVVVGHDQTFIERLNYFPFEQRPPCNAYVGQAILKEGEVFRNANLIVYPSHRSINMVRSAYKIDDARLAMIPWGGNLAIDPTTSEVEQAIIDRGFGPFTLTFIGVDWRRKGGHIVLAAHKLLRERGIDVRLNIIGVEPSIPLDSAIRVIPFLSKKDPADIERLSDILSRTHLLFVPSRVEAFGHVFAEAAAFGVPSVAQDVGGVATIIENGVSGILLPEHAGAEAFADAIGSLFARPEDYVTMARTVRRRYDVHLNWRAYCSSILSTVFNQQSA